MIKEYVKSKKEELKNRVAALDRKPGLAIFQIGENEASNRYIKNKIKDCNEIGIEVHHYWYPEDIGEEEFYEEIAATQDFYDGVIVQLPVPAHISKKNIVDVNKDVDGFNIMSPFDPATPKGIMDYLKWRNFDLTGKNVVIIGRSEIVGKPLARMMTDADATVTLCHSKSNLARHLYDADLTVCAVGKAKFLNCYAIHVPVIDVGINFDENGKMVGDCYNTEGRDVTPVPGGVGLLTRCALLENVILAKEWEEKKNALD